MKRTGIKPKMGICPDCKDKSGKPIIAGKCRYHYWQPKRSEIARATNPIVKRSKKRERQESKYRNARDKYLAEHPICEFPECGSREVTLHHMKGRIGSLLHDKRYFKALCWPHHQWVELNPDEAKKMGLSLSRLSND